MAQQWHTQASGPPSKNRGPVVVALAIGAVLVLAAVGFGGWWLGAHGDTEPPEAVASPAAASPVVSEAKTALPSPSTRAYDVGTLNTCTAVSWAARNDLPAEEDLIAVIDTAETSELPAIRKVADKFAARTYLDGHQALTALAGWCDRHNVNFPPDKED